MQLRSEPFGSPSSGDFLEENIPATVFWIVIPVKNSLMHFAMDSHDVHFHQKSLPPSSVSYMYFHWRGFEKKINSLRFLKIFLTKNNSYLKKKKFFLGEKVKQKFEVGANGPGRSG